MSQKQVRSFLTGIALGAAGLFGYQQIVEHKSGNKFDSDNEITVPFTPSQRDALSKGEFDAALPAMSDAYNKAVAQELAKDNVSVKNTLTDPQTGKDVQQDFPFVVANTQYNPAKVSVVKK